MKTKSGNYIIFDITEFLPGRLIPETFFNDMCTGPWYFMPAAWSEENDWGGSIISKFTKFPLPYSLGHETAEKALEEAEAWEIQRGNMVSIKEAFKLLGKSA